MKDIFAPQPQSVQHCPAWCSGAHLPAAGGSVVHISVDQFLTVGTGREARTAYVSIEQSDNMPAAVRLEGVSSTPMTADQAMQLSWMLSAAAFAAVSGQAVAR